MLAAPDVLQHEEIAPPTPEQATTGLLDYLRRSTVLPIAASLSMLVASAGADEKKSSAQTPQATMEMKKKEMADFSVPTLVELTGANDWASRAAAAEVLRDRTEREMQRTKKPLEWKNELSLTGKSTEQKRTLGSILDRVETLERSFWWEGTPMVLDAATKQRMGTLEGTLAVLEEKANCPVIITRQLEPNTLKDRVTNIPDSGSFWEVLRSLRVQGDKQLMPFSTNGALMLKLEDASLPTASNGALYGVLSLQHERALEVHLFPEPKVFGRAFIVTGAKNAYPSDSSHAPITSQHGVFTIARPRGANATGIMSLSVSAQGSEMKKFHCDGPHGRTIEHDGQRYEWYGIPQQADADGQLAARLTARDHRNLPNSLNSVHCVLRDAEGQKIEAMRCGHKWFPAQLYWEVLDKRKPASADLYVPGGSVGQTQRTLQFSNVPHLPLPPQF